MSLSDGYGHEMAARITDEQAEAILRGDVPGERAELGDLISRIRALGELPIEPAVIERHVSMLVREAAISAGDRRPEPGFVHRRLPEARNRRSIVFSSLLSSLLGKVLAASVAVAAVGGGIGYVADTAAPGDVLYGVDRAFEAVGIGRGGAAERIEEAKALVAEERLAEAVATAGEAVEAAAGAEAAEALREAASTIAAVEDGDAAEITRERVAALLEVIAAGIEGDGVVGSDVAELARSIGRDRGRGPEGVQLPDQAEPSAVPPSSAASDGTPETPTEDPVQPVETTPAPEADTGDVDPSNPATTVPAGRP